MPMYFTRRLDGVSVCMDGVSASRFRFPICLVFQLAYALEVKILLSLLLKILLLS